MHTGDQRGGKLGCVITVLWKPQGDSHSGRKEDGVRGWRELRAEPGEDADVAFVVSGLEVTGPLVSVVVFCGVTRQGRKLSEGWVLR